MNSRYPQLYQRSCSLYDGPAMTRVPIVGNPTKPCPRVSTRAQDAIPDTQRTQVVTEYLFQDFPRLFQVRLVFPLRILTSCILLAPFVQLYLTEHPLELGWIQPRKRRGTVTSQHILYYCTYYSVTFTCTAHCTYIHTAHCTHSACSLFPSFRCLGFIFNICLPHLFTLILVHTLSSIHILVFTQCHSHLLTKHICISLVFGALHHRGSVTE